MRVLTWGFAGRADPCERCALMHILCMRTHLMHILCYAFVIWTDNAHDDLA